MKKIAKTMVRSKPMIAFLLSPAKIAWCAKVTVAPDDSKIMVFNKGVAKGSKISIPSGGQTPPISATGVILASKKAQKKPTKNITSETMKRMNPIFIPA